MKHKTLLSTALAATLTLPLAGAAPAPSATAGGFDPDTGSAPIEVVIPAVAPIILTSVSPNAGDATLVLRITTTLTVSWFDAIAPYNPTAIGVYSSLGRRPAGEATQRNRNIAILHASFHTLMSLLPQHGTTWRNMLLGVGLDPDDPSTDLTTAVGIGNSAGLAVVQARENDGMNQLGNMPVQGSNIPVAFNGRPYSDYTGYAPVNTAYDLVDPSRWQPAIVTSGSGIFRVQQFVTPQLRLTEPFSYQHPQQFRAPFPFASQVENFAAYKQQADIVLATSAALTDQQKMMAEFFDNKIDSLGFSILFVATVRNFTLEQFVQLDMLANIAAFDTAIAIWQEKARFDAVRPFSAIRHIYGNQHVTAWGGPGQGTVSNLPASQWTSYLPVADHPEYPSASASFCAAHATAARLFLGDDNLGWQIPVPAGSSRIEPGVTPASNIVLDFPTWTDFARACGDSRVWGGVHFPASVPAGQRIGVRVGERAYNFVMDRIAGN